MQNDFLF